LNCVDSISDNRFISGADEKLLRVFNKPKAVDTLLSRLGGIAASVQGDLPDAANIPMLGLSNKAVTAVEDGNQVNSVSSVDAENGDAIDPSPILQKSTLDLDHPPFEDHLARYTLWPEHEKLYGHGYEISAVATSSDGKLVATACKASSLDHAVIRLYDTQEWREIRPPLTAHSLTVTSLSFSPDDHYLLSVGRDRQWAVFERSRQDFKTYVPLTANPKGHSRMILDCAWAPAAAGHVFATAGRDKTVRIWTLGEGNAECKATLPSEAPVTAIAFSERTPSGELLLAHGNEEGVIALVSLDPHSFEVLATTQVDRTISPSKTINTLRWRPRLSPEPQRASKMKCQLASASDDCSVRIYNVEAT
jgi:elongator complex protein 2